jgi:protease-4
MIRLLLALFTCGWLLAGCYVNVDLPIAEEQPMEERVVGGTGPAKIALLDFSGMMTSDWISRVGGSAGTIEVSEVREQLARAAADPTVRAVVLRINSPGGEVTTADILYHEIRSFRERSGKPVIASIGAVGASGGYYVALASDEIWANPTGVVGSIGVLLMRFNAQGLLEKIGVQGEVLASGDRKRELAAPLEPLTPESRAVLTRVLNRHYERFVGLVTKHRPLSQTEAYAVADGSVFAAEDARQERLVDQVGYLQDALQAAQQRAGLQAATFITYQRPGSFRPSLLDVQGPQINMVNIDYPLPRSSSFLYLWQP